MKAPAAERWFVAWSVPATLAAAWAPRLAEARRRWPSARWVPPSRLHLTLLFLGNLERPGPLPVGEALRAAVAESAVPPLELGAAGGVFPAHGPPQVLWIGGGPEAPWEALHRRLAAAARSAGWRGPAGDGFRLHVTVARCRWTPAGMRRGWREMAAGLPGRRLRVRTLHLLRSRPARGRGRGVVHERVAGLRFGRGVGPAAVPEGQQG